MSRLLTAILGCLLGIAAWSAAMPPSVTLASNGWSRAHKISDVTMDELVSAVDSRGHVYAAGALGYRNGPLYLLTNASGKWVQSELAQSPRRGAINGLAMAVDTDDSVWILYHRWSFWNPCGMGCPPGGPSKLDAAYVINNVGGTWSRPVALPDRIHPDVRSFSVRDGNIHVAWGHTPRGGQSEVVYATNIGGWHSYVVGKGWGPHLQLDADGKPWIGYTAPEYAGGVIVAHWNNAKTSFIKSRAPGTSAKSGTATADGMGLDSAGRPVVLFDRYEPKHGYWTYWVRLGTDGVWARPHRLFNNWGVESAVDSHDRIHVLYDVWDTASADGLYYGRSTGAIATSLRIDRSTRFAEDAPSPAETLSVDSSGRPHVVYAVPYNENRSGTWYLVGPAD